MILYIFVRVFNKKRRKIQTQSSWENLILKTILENKRIGYYVPLKKDKTCLLMILVIDYYYHLMSVYLFLKIQWHISQTNVLTVPLMMTSFGKADKAELIRLSWCACSLKYFMEKENLIISFSSRNFYTHENKDQNN